MNKLSLWGIILTIFVMVSPSILALSATRIISNSENWEDVYSSMLFASLDNIKGDFLTSTTHGPILLNSISTSERIGIVSSKDNPFVFGYKQMVESRGYSSVEEIQSDNANLDLINEPELNDIKNFIVVDNSYGFSAMAVTPYAVKSKSWVFLANRVNIAEIQNILANRQISNLIIYGYVEREVLDSLQQFNPKIINNEDRFKDNVEIVKEYKKIDDTKQVILSNGEFIERELMEGAHPILFTGRDNVPDQIANYLKESDISVGVLIGNELINAATNIRRTTGLSVMVKFAQGARSQTSGVSAVEGLDLFPLPTPTVNLEIYSARYNRASSKVEITYHSKSNIPIYFKGTLTAISDDDRVKAGDLEPIFIAPNDYKTIVYPDILLRGENLRADITTFFGDVPTSLDYRLQANVNLSIINTIDKCDVEPTYVKYNIQRETFIINVKNKGDVSCYVDIELTDVKINNRKQTIGTEGSQLVKSGESKKIEISQRMTQQDLNDNPFVDLVAYYGEKEDSLVNIYKQRFALDIDRYTLMTYLIAAVVIALIFLILFWWRLKKKKGNEWD